MKICFALILCLALTFPSASWANSAPVLVRGIGAVDVVPIKNNQIRMVREVVDIDCASSTYTVQVDFWFKNTTDQVAELKMGFPVEYKTFFEDTETIQESCRSFKVEWKNVPVKFSFGKLQEGENIYRQWIYWTAHFAPNEEVTNRVSYTFPTWSIDAGDKMDTIPYMYMKYILKTGATWAGPIESSVVKIRYGKSFSECREVYCFPDPPNLTFYPKGAVVDEKSRTVTWEFKNLVPTQDIYFGLGGVPDFESLDKEQSPVLQNFPPPPNK